MVEPIHFRYLKEFGQSYREAAAVKAFFYINIKSIQTFDTLVLPFKVRFFKIVIFLNETYIVERGIVRHSWNKAAENEAM